MVNALEAQQIVDELLSNNMAFYVNQYIIPEIKSVALAANLPDKFIAGIKFRQVGEMQGEVINTWGSKDQPLAKWFNDGTPDHDIWSKGPWPLHWQSLLGGEVFVSTKNKPVRVRGLPFTNAMGIGIQLGIKRIIAEVPRDVEDKI